jgi:hypothetical protein
MTPFLDCNVWSVNPDLDPNGFAMVEKVYHYNSLLGDCNTLEHNVQTGFIQIPQFEIQNLELLNLLDFQFINEHKIPIIKILNNTWSIDLYYYEQNIKL